MLEIIFSTTPCENMINLFGITHLSITTISVITAILIVKHKMNLNFIIKASTIIVFILHLMVYVWYHFSPESFIVKGLPLYTCRMTMYLLMFGIFFNNKFCLKLGNYWGFFGGIAGLILPTMFKYPFPHILQISTFTLHVYIFLVSTYYLFVERIGMNKKDLKMCCLCTVSFLIVITIINGILGSNYSATFKMPAHLINFGFNIPVGTCAIVVILGYLAAIFTQYKLVNKYEEKMLEKVK